MRFYDVFHQATQWILILSCCVTVQAYQNVKISGTVTDMSGTPLQNVGVSLSNIIQLSTVSLNDGTFLLEQSSEVIQSLSNNNHSSFFINRKGLYFTQQQESPVTITLFDLQGASVAKLTKGTLGPGTHFFSITNNSSCMPLIVHVVNNGTASNVFYNPLNYTLSHRLCISQNAKNSIAQSSEYNFNAVDTVIFTKAGYITEHVPIESYITTLSVKVQKATIGIMIPNYEPDYWNDDWFINDCNNCYNYSNNRRTNTFAQPGRASGQRYTSNTCENVGAAALRDGLEPCAGLTEPIPSGKARIALTIDPGSDYHWYREDRDKMWSHKPGKGTANNVDNSGKLISDPEKADRGKYTEFCGYFFVDSDSIQGGGHEHIRQADSPENTLVPSGKLKISFMLYSGREDPSFHLDDDATVNKLLSLLHSTEILTNYQRNSVEPLMLGYRGVLIELVASERRERYVVYNNLVEHGYIVNGKRIKSFHRNNSGTIQQWLLDKALNGKVITPEEYHSMVSNK